MEFTKGIPPKEPLAQYILQMKNHPDAVGLWNNAEDSFLLASMQCSQHNGEPYDCWYEGMFIEESDITGFCEI